VNGSEHIGGDGMKKVRYFAIEREYGSGGTEIARRIAANTGVPCYGKEIIENIAKELHIPVDEVERYEEKVTGSVLYTFYMMAQAHSGNSDMLTREGQIFVTEQSEIQRLAKQGSAIFLGHCACEALKEEEGVIKVFIRCSDDKQKQDRIIRDYGIKKTEVNTVRERFDKKRANYYHANTNCKWRDSGNYDIVLDTAVLGIDGCVGVLEGLLLC
jgi:cytidylate kinase